VATSCNALIYRLAPVLCTGENMAENMAKIISEPGKQEFFIEREFDAPREMVFKAHTDPDLYGQWIGGSSFQTIIERFEARNGGSYRFVQKDGAGNQYAFHGVYHEVLPYERTIGTFEYEGLPETGHVSLDSSRFEDLPGGRTRVIVQSIFLTVADRDGMLQSGMEEGLNDNYRQLDKLLERMKVGPRPA